MDEYPILKLAAAQFAPVFMDRDKTVEKACRIILEAGKNGADVIGFPETFIPGYPHWYEFYGLGDPKVMAFYKELFKNSVVVPSRATDELCAAAKEAGTDVVMGITERDENSMGTLYNTLLYISREGKITGKHRKLVPTSYERLVHGAGDGSTLSVIKTPYGGLGGLICGENTNSLARFALIAKQETVHVASWPAFPTRLAQFEAIDFRARNHAFEAKCFVISVTGIFSEEMKDIIGIDDKAREKFVTDGGNSAIIGPLGDVLVRAGAGECIIYADADFEKILEGKMKHDVTGHYNRFDIFKLTVNEEPQTPLIIEKP